MPNSRHRHKHHGPQQHTHSTTPKPQKRNAATLMAIFVGVFGAAISALFSHSDFMWIAIGTLAGAVAGYFVGKGIDNTVAKK